MNNETRTKKIENFADLEAWIINHEVAILVYKLTKKFPRDEKFGLVVQLRRAASSVTANIAEGFGRYHFKDKVKFYYNARGSNSEVQSFLILAKDLGYVENEDFYNRIIERVLQGGRLLNGLIRSTEERS